MHMLVTGSDEPQGAAREETTMTISTERTSDDDFAVYRETDAGFEHVGYLADEARAAFDAHEGPQVPPPPPPETVVRRFDRAGWINEQDRLWLANEKAKMEARIAQLRQESERRRIAEALAAGEWLGSVAL